MGALTLFNPIPTNNEGGIAQPNVANLSIDMSTEGQLIAAEIPADMDYLEISELQNNNSGR